MVSQEKFDEMVAELDNLKTVRRTEIAKNLEYARSLGDLSENAEYQEARDLQAVVGFGSVVVIKKEGGGDTHEYTIVGSEEADMRAHKLSHVSPLGAALMGKKKGEMFTFETPNGKQSYAIEKVS